MGIDGSMVLAFGWLRAPPQRASGCEAPESRSKLESGSMGAQVQRPLGEIPLQAGIRIPYWCSSSMAPRGNPALSWNLGRFELVGRRATVVWRAKGRV